MRYTLHRNRGWVKEKLAAQEWGWTKEKLTALEWGWVKEKLTAQEWRVGKGEAHCTGVECGKRRSSLHRSGG